MNTEHFAYGDPSPAQFSSPGDFSFSMPHMPGNNQTWPPNFSGQHTTHGPHTHGSSSSVAAAPNPSSHLVGQTPQSANVPTSNGLNVGQAPDSSPPTSTSASPSTSPPPSGPAVLSPLFIDNLGKLMKLEKAQVDMLHLTAKMGASPPTPLSKADLSTRILGMAATYQEAAAARRREREIWQAEEGALTPGDVLGVIKDLNVRLKGPFIFSQGQRTCIRSLCGDEMYKSTRTSFKDSYIDALQRLRKDAGTYQLTNVVGDPDREKMLAALVKRTSSSVRNSYREELVRFSIGPHALPLETMTVRLSQRFMLGGMGREIPNSLTIRNAILRRFVLEHRTEACAPCPEETAQAEESAGKYLNHVPSKRTSGGTIKSSAGKKRGGRIANGADFWSLVDAWFAHEIDTRGRDLAGSKWKDYVEETLRLDKKRFDPSDSDVEDSGDSQSDTPASFVPQRTAGSSSQAGYDAPPGRRLNTPLTSTSSAWTGDGFSGKSGQAAEDDLLKMLEPGEEFWMVCSHEATTDKSISKLPIHLREAWWQSGRRLATVFYARSTRRVLKAHCLGITLPECGPPATFSALWCHNGSLVGSETSYKFKDGTITKWPAIYYHRISLHTEAALTAVYNMQVTQRGVALEVDMKTYLDTTVHIEAKTSNSDVVEAQLRNTKRGMRLIASVLALAEAAVANAGDMQRRQTRSYMTWSCACARRRNTPAGRSANRRRVWQEERRTATAVAVAQNEMGRTGAAAALVDELEARLCASVERAAESEEDARESNARATQSFEHVVEAERLQDVKQSMQELSEKLRGGQRSARRRWRRVLRQPSPACQLEEQASRCVQKAEESAEDVSTPKIAAQYAFETFERTEAATTHTC
ncbi:hypothetical protein EV121DRAFT_287176 [Schizophyllum commune]